MIRLVIDVEEAAGVDVPTVSIEIRERRTRGTTKAEVVHARVVQASVTGGLQALAKGSPRCRYNEVVTEIPSVGGSV